MIEPYYISLAVVLIGAFCGLILPYLIKCREDPETVFDWSYMYTLLVTSVISAVALIPESIKSSPQYYVSLFLAALGLQTIMSKAKRKS